MRRNVYRKNTGGAWLMGFGLLGLLVTIAIILILVNAQAESLKSSTGGRGPGEFIKDVRQQVHGLEQQHNDSVNDAIKDSSGRAKPAASPAAPPTAPPPPSPALAPEAPAPAAPALVPTPAVASPAPAASGVPSAGTPIGPISPIAPLAPIQPGPGPNLRPATRPVTGVNDAIQKRNEELERALKGG